MAETTASLLKKIRYIQYQTEHLANALLAGAYRSAFKGKGMEFEEVREYFPGDDVRTIDWNVTARMDKPYVKCFREERELTITLLVDVSASTMFGSGSRSKKEFIAEIAALLAFSAIKNHDKVALILFSDRIEKYIPANKGTGHVLRIVRELLVERSCQKKTDINAAFSFLGKISIHSGICFLISDFMCPDFSHQASLIAKRHDLIAVGVVDPSELNFPSMGFLTVKDLETEKTVMFESHVSSLNKNITDNLNAKKKLMHKLGGSFIELRTDKSFLFSFRQFFLSKGQDRK